MAIFSTFTSLLSWRISSVTSKSSNYTIVLINATNGKPTTRLIVQLFTPAKLPDDTRCDTRQLHVYGLLPPSWPTVLRWQHSVLYGNFKRKPWRPRPRCTDCWMDRGRLHVDCYHDSRATLKLGPASSSPAPILPS